MHERHTLQMKNSSCVVQVIDSSVGCPNLPVVDGKGSAKAVLWPGNGARHRTVHVIDLVPGDRTIDFKHFSDAVYYVASGEGEIIDISSGDRFMLVEGSMVHIDRGDPYRFRTEAGMKLIGGPCPADYSLYSNIVLAEPE